MSWRPISCHKGLAPIYVPSEWIREFDMEHGFASQGSEGLINCGVHGAFGVRAVSQGPNVTPVVRRLSDEEQQQVQWGGFCSPWESWDTAQLFGTSSRFTKLDEVK